VDPEEGFDHADVISGLDARKKNMHRFYNKTCAFSYNCFFTFKKMRILAIFRIVAYLCFLGNEIIVGVVTGVKLR